MKMVCAYADCEWSLDIPTIGNAGLVDVQPEPELANVDELCRSHYNDVHNGIEDPALGASLGEDDQNG